MAEDKEPMLFRSMLGSLRPVTEAADELVTATSGEIVAVDVKRTTGNTRRMAIYWIGLRIGVEQLSDAVDGILTTKSLHRKLKRDAGLAREIKSKKTGEVIDYDYESISFTSMPENERSAYVDWAFGKLSVWIGTDIETLIKEARKEAA